MDALAPRIALNISHDRRRLWRARGGARRKARALAAAAGLGVLFTVCFLLLSLRLGGQAHYAAPYIAAPLFGSLALVACCCCCVACVSHARRRERSSRVQVTRPTRR